MARLCGQCGYDVTSVPVQPAGRLCPECGRVGRGVRRWRHFGRALVRSSAVGMGIWVVAIVVLAMLALTGGFKSYGGVDSVFTAVFGVLATAAVLTSFVEPARVAKRLGRSLPPGERRWWQVKLLAASFAVQLAAGVFVLGLIVGLTALLR